MSTCTSDSGIRRWKSVPDNIGQPGADAGKPSSIAEILDNRRQNRMYRRKPWTEKATIKHNSPKYIQGLDMMSLRYKMNGTINVFSKYIFLSYSAISVYLKIMHTISFID